MPRLRHSRSDRPRVRLLSTPGTTHLEGPLRMASTTVAEMKFSPQTAELLIHAMQHGFRIEPDTRGRSKVNAVIAYPPDKNLPPISINERGAKFNKAHYENLRRDLARAGMPPLDTDQPTPTPAATPAAKETPEMPATDRVLHLHNARELDAALTGSERSEAIAGMVNGLFERADLGPMAGIAAGIIYTLAANYDEVRDDMARIAAERAVAHLGEEVNAATELAAAAEEKAGRLETALAKADAKNEKLTADLRAALERAKTAEATLAENEAVLGPLRALLAGK